MLQLDKNTLIFKYAIIAGDFIILNLLLLTGYYFRDQILMSPDHANNKILFLCANFAMALAQNYHANKVYRRNLRTETVLRNTFWLTFWQVLVAYALIRIVGFYNLPFKWVPIFAVSLYLLLLLSRVVERFIIKGIRASGKNSHEVTLVGDDPMLLLLYKRLTEDTSMGYRVKGYYADNDLESCPEELHRLGSLADLNRSISDDGDLKDNHDIFCCMSHDRDEQIRAIMKFCDKHVIHFFYVPRMLGNFALGLKRESLMDIPIYANHEAPLYLLQNRCLKRAFDLVFASGVCLCLLPIIPILAIIIKIQSPGPLFFRQERTGIGGKTFRIFKFRSMHVNKDADTLQATEHDPRKFAFGDFMRRTNIDELPQFFNVLLGDMSIVGPRPHMLKHTEMYSAIIDKYMVRHLAKPGITGWAQVNGFRGETKEVWMMEERVKRDIWYVENWSIWLDLRIIYLTVKNMVLRKDTAAY